LPRPKVFCTFTFATNPSSAMKTTLFCCVLACMPAAALFSQDKTAEKEKTAIRKVIEAETEAFVNVDRKGWEAAWADVPYACWSYADSTGTTFVEGWKSISRFFDAYFKTAQPSRTIDVAKAGGKVQVNREWKEIRVYGTGAFTRHTQRVSNGSINMDETSHVRVLEKKDGQWKIVCVMVIATYPED
jgi:hypothetical protein